MDLYTRFTQTTVVGNELWRIVLLFVILLASLVIGKIANIILLSAASRKEKNGAAMPAAGFRALASVSSFVMLVVGLEAILSLDILVLSSGLRDVAETVSGILFIIAVAWLAYRLVDVEDQWLKQVAARTDSKIDDMLVPLVRKSLRITIIILAIIQAATILSDKPVTSLIAGLGIGSLAIALGAQETMKNFFGSLVILADKPFEIGNRIVVGENDGIVEEIGFRSTRIRTLTGHLVTVPNSIMASMAINNIGKRPHIRRLLTISVTYDTPPEKVQRAVDIIKDILNDHEGMHADFPPRVYFEGFGSSSLNILVLYWYHPPEYWDFMSFSERVNMRILQKFNEEGIDFAFPTQTLYLAGDARRPLNPEQKI